MLTLAFHRSTEHTKHTKSTQSTPRIPKRHTPHQVHHRDISHTKSWAVLALPSLRLTAASCSVEGAAGLCATTGLPPRRACDLMRASMAMANQGWPPRHLSCRERLQDQCWSGHPTALAGPGGLVCVRSAVAVCLYF